VTKGLLRVAKRGVSMSRRASRASKVLRPRVQELFRRTARGSFMASDRLAVKLAPFTWLIGQDPISSDRRRQIGRRRCDVVVDIVPSCVAPTLGVSCTP
jgi:hypothetical protein